MDLAVEKSLSNLEILPESREEEILVASLNSLDRLGAINKTGFLDGAPEPTFQILTELATKLLETPVSLIVLVTDNRQFFVSNAGLGEPWASRRETPLSHSFCQYVTMRNQPLVIRDARRHHLVSENKAIKELGVVAYLGVPLVAPGGEVLGSFCVIDSQPRDWTRGELSLLQKLAIPTLSEMETRKAANVTQIRLESRLRQAEKLEAIGNLTGGIAHDFNNILASVQGYADLLKMTLPESCPAITHVDSLQTVVDNAREIVQQLLNWNRGGEIEYGPISVGSTVRDALPLIRALLPTSIVLEVTAPDSDDTIHGHAGQLVQILMNLCSNAEHSMRGKAGKLKIFVDAMDLDSSTGEIQGKKVRLSIVDEGCGIPIDEVHRVFDPFYTTKGEGTGLGLSTVYAAVSAMDGEVVVQSSCEKGTTIDVSFSSLPIRISERPSRRSLKNESRRTARILFVDDNPSILDVMKIQLVRLGYEVTCTTDSAKALMIFRENRTSFDLLITDQTMPNLQGNELIREVKAIAPELPAILCTGFSSVVNAQNVDQYDIDAFCTKPIRIGELSELIQSVLSSPAIKAA